jgi:TPR repeat protein
MDSQASAPLSVEGTSSPQHDAEEAERTLQEALELRNNYRYPEALLKLRQAVALGSARAMWELGWCYDLGSLTLVEDEATAAYFYQKSAELGYAPGQAEYALALFLGAGAAQNFEESMIWAKKALESGDDYALGMCHESGLGGLQMDDNAALVHYKRSAALGFAAGQHRVGALTTGQEETVYMSLAAAQGELCCG